MKHKTKFNTYLILGDIPVGSFFRPISCKCLYQRTDYGHRYWRGFDKKEEFGSPVTRLDMCVKCEMDNFIPKFRVIDELKDNRMPAVLVTYPERGYL